jgi:hypothetical protein
MLRSHRLAMDLPHYLPSIPCHPSTQHTLNASSDHLASIHELDLGDELRLEP